MSLDKRPPAFCKYWRAIPTCMDSYTSGRPFLRIFPGISGFVFDFRNSLHNHFQAAWITMRRRVTRRLVVIQAVWIGDQCFVHKAKYLSKYPDFSCSSYGHPDTLYSACFLRKYILIITSHAIFSRGVSELLLMSILVFHELSVTNYRKEALLYEHIIHK